LNNGVLLFIVLVAVASAMFMARKR
jgi:hypothetical protein